MEETKKRVRRSKEELFNDKVAKIDEKIANLEQKLAEAKKEKEELLSPKTTMKDITAMIKENDLSLDDVMKAVEKMANKK